MLYPELPAPPEPFNGAQLVERHGGEEHLGAVGVACLPREQPPELGVVGEVRVDLDPDKVFGVGQGCEEGDQDDADHERLADWGVGEARGDHCGMKTRRDGRVVGLRHCW